MYHIIQHSTYSSEAAVFSFILIIINHFITKGLTDDGKLFNIHSNKGHEDAAEEEGRTFTFTEQTREKLSVWSVEDLS